jgi:hypothetical protein
MDALSQGCCRERFGDGFHRRQQRRRMVMSIVLAAVVAPGLTAGRADELRPVLHLRAADKVGLRDLAGPHVTVAYSGSQLGPDLGDPDRAQMLGRLAWGFEGRRDSQLFLAQGANDELRIKGALTLAAVVQVDELPSNKAAIISKWQLIDIGRAFELGVGQGGCIYFHVSASGMWDENAAEIVADRPVKLGVPYLVAGAFEPGQRLEVYINGIRANEEPLGRPVPQAICNVPTPVLVGSRPGMRGMFGLTGKICDVWIFDRALTAGQLRRLTRDAGVTSEVEPVPADPQPPYDLNAIRDDVRRWYGRLQDPDGPYGAYRMRPKSPPDLYASADVA